MNLKHSKALLTTLFLLILIGIGSIGFALWLIDHRQALPNSGIIVPTSAGVFFVSFTAALLLFIRWRNSRHTMSVRTTPSTVLSEQDLEGTVYGMVPGSTYQVVKSFVDFYGNSFQQGEILRFKERHFVPYHGGHTIVFDERSLYLQEEKNEQILENFKEFVVKVVQ